MNMIKVYSDYVSGNRIEFGIAVGLVIGLLLGLAIPDSGVTFNEKVVKKTGIANADELCSTIYGADYGHGEGITSLECYKNYTWYNLGARDLSKALNSSYTIGEN